MKINQLAIAEQLALSPATVSRAFQPGSRIKASTRARIFEAAARMGYRPNAKNIATASSSARPPVSRYIGVLVNSGEETNPNSDAVRVNYLHGLSEAARESGASLVVDYVPSPRSGTLLDKRQQPQALRDGILSGLIFVHRFTDHIVKEMAHMLPCVTITHEVADSRTDHIDSDAYSAMEAMIQHLVDLGHRSIGFAGYWPHITWSRLRHDAWMLAMARRGLSCAPKRVIASGMLEEKGVETRDEYEQMARACHERTEKDVTAWICSTDMLAYTLMSHFRHVGLRVPKEVSICGYDGRVPMLGMPAVTTTKVPFREMGVAALTLLLDRIQHLGAPHRRLLLNTELFIGASTGPVPR